MTRAAQKRTPTRLSDLKVHGEFSRKSSSSFGSCRTKTALREGMAACQCREAALLNSNLFREAVRSQVGCYREYNSTTSCSLTIGLISLLVGMRITVPLRLSLSATSHSGVEMAEV